MSWIALTRSLALVVLIVGLRLFIVGCTCDPIYPDDAGADVDGVTPDGAKPDGAEPDQGPKDGPADTGQDSPTSTGPYGPCPCPAQSTCLTSGCGTCAPNCFSLADCPQASSGTAKPECLPQGGGPEGVCLLICGTLGTCPTGMECDNSYSPMPACLTKCP